MKPLSVRPLTLTLALAVGASGCSLRRMAINTMADALAGGGSNYASDDDPQLVWDAVPFGLKTIEGLLIQAPDNKNLLLAAASGFTEYAYGALQQEADYTEATDLAHATELRARARKLYRRALEYGLRGLEVGRPGFRKALRADPPAAVAKVGKADVPLLYWTANAWGAAISISKDDAELTADQNLAEALMRRALALDEGYERGSIHDFFIAYEGGRASVGGSIKRARQHLERARALSHGARVSPLVTFAEVVSVGTQNRKEFEQFLNEALALDPNKVTEVRLANLLAQRRARWLLGRADELFVE